VSASAGADGQFEAPLLRGGVRVVDGDDAGDGLMLEPFAGVPLGGPGAGGEFPGGEWASRRQRAVVAETVAEVGGLDELGAPDRAEQAVGELIGRRLGGGGPLPVEGGAHRVLLVVSWVGAGRRTR